MSDTTARKTTAKKSTARKSTAKKSTAKKSTAKKSTAKKSTAKKSTAKKTTAKKTSGAFSADERAAMKERAAEARAAKAGADGETELLAKIAEMSSPDRGLAERVHAVLMDAVPEFEPRTWYGMPAYALDGKTVCFFQPAEKFKARYSTLGFNDPAQLDDGAMWPTAYAITRLNATLEKKIAALAKKAAG